MQKCVIHMTPRHRAKCKGRILTSITE